MIRTILVPIDGSEFSEHALPLARAVAQRTGATVQLVSVLEAESGGVSNDPVGLGASFDAERREYVWQHLASLAADLASSCEVRYDVRSGPAVPALEDAARVHAADLIVMATHGRGGLERLRHGSVADELIRATRLPVMLSRPPGELPAPTSAAPLGRILVALDGSMLAEGVLPVVRQLGQRGCEIVLARVRRLNESSVVTPPETGGLPDDEDRVVGFGEDEVYLQRIVAGLVGEGIAASEIMIEDEEPADAIMSAADDREADLIALATHGRGGLRRALLGSVADRIARHCTRPVLLYRPRE